MYRRKVPYGQRAPCRQRESERRRGITHAVNDSGERAGFRANDVSEEYEFRQTAQVQGKIGHVPLPRRDQHCLRVDFVEKLQHYYGPCHDPPTFIAKTFVKEKQRRYCRRARRKPYPVHGTEFAPTQSRRGIFRNLPKRRKSAARYAHIRFHSILSRK